MLVAEHYREDLQDVRIYKPKCGKHPNGVQARYIGKPVHVVWQQPIFTFAGGNPKIGLVHELTQWFGYVVEFDKQIPQDELIRQLRLPAPKDKPNA